MSLIWWYIFLLTDKLLCCWKQRKHTYMVFCSAHSWTCPSAWKRPRPSRRCPGRPCWWCWSQPWRRRRWWARAPQPALPFDSHSWWRCWEARQMLDDRRKRKTKHSGLDFSAAVTDACQRLGACLVRWLSWRRPCEQLLAQPGLTSAGVQNELASSLHSEQSYSLIA